MFIDTLIDYNYFPNWMAYRNFWSVFTQIL